MTLPSDTKPGDVFKDAQGRVWWCIGTCREPTAILECLSENPPERKNGGMSGHMWNGFTRLTPEGS